MSEIRQALVRYMVAVKALGERSAGTPHTYFDEHPMSDEGVSRWRELDAAGKQATAALADTQEG